MVYRIKVIAPSGLSSNAKESMSILLKFQQIIEAKYNSLVYFDNDIFTKENQIINYSNNVTFRKDDLVNSLQSDEYDIIWCFRGGYGAIEILNQLECNPFLLSKNKKYFIGFSDISVLHAINNSTNVQSIHGNVITKVMSELDKNYSCPMEKIYTLIRENQNIYLNSRDKNVCGGNLASIVSLNGTKYHKDFTNKIVLLEDTNEEPYKIKKMIMQLIMANNLCSSKKIIFGSFVHKNNYNYKQILLDIQNEFNLNVEFVDDVGHCDINNPVLLSY
jgi:muramoyltetrapeptide carboxypeptidase